MTQCQLCDKKATVHLTEIVEGQQIVKHLCQECAQNEGLAIQANAPISEMLGNLIDAQQEAQQGNEIRCPQCGLTWSDFRKQGLLGCPNDYIAFGKPLQILIERAQNNATKHSGQLPQHHKGNFGQQVRLLQLRQDLQTAVEAEDYEAAVKLRDEINKFTTSNT